MCVAVASPGQALLLGNVVDVFGSDNMKERGNFISLMFFVMSLGLLAVYGGMGWSTNIIAQVCFINSFTDYASVAVTLTSPFSHYRLSVRLFERKC